jgi:hypothetical protein
MVDDGLGQRLAVEFGGVVAQYFGGVHLRSLGGGGKG